jgi:AcrR family transcriptional regulator
MARTRSAAAHKKVLGAALELVGERGVDATSMDAVAQKSGVSKATIYKHWADKDALLLEMMAEAVGLESRPVFDTGHTRADMTAVLAYRKPETNDFQERVLPHFMAYAARNREFGMAWRKKVMEPPIRDLTRLIKSGIQKGELSPNLEMEVALGLLLGPMLYWHIFLKDATGHDPEHLAKGVIDAFWKAFRRS